MNLLKTFAPVLVLAACASGGRSGSTTSAPAVAHVEITDTESLMRAMRDRYAGKWYRTLTFVQASTFYKPDGSVDRVETWREAGMMPGRLRIDTDTAAGRGVIYANDSLYIFNNGQLARTLDRQNELMVLGFDVYHLEPAQSAAKLAKLGFDITKIRRALHDGKEYWVVGGAANDPSTGSGQGLASKQFWIEADRLLFWRVFLPPAQPGRPVQEIRFQDYKQHGGGWVGEEVDFLENGKRTFFEKYAEVKTDVPLDAAVFDPKRYAETRFWWRK
jgi:hypothetical protein